MIYPEARFACVDQLCLLIAAVVIGAFMTMNIGVHDVVNNVGPAVGPFALSLTGAVVVAALGGAGGAIMVIRQMNNETALTPDNSREGVNKLFT